MWPFLKSMNPAEDTLALGSTEVDLSDILVGQSITVKWRGKPVFIRRRTQEEISEANNVDVFHHYVILWKIKIEFNKKSG